MSGDLLGTLRYMSPEQALAQRVLVDQRTDIYSLGATLYELLTLEPAFPGTDRQELLRQIACQEPRLPCKRNKAIPTDLQTIVLKAMAKDPAERYSTAQDLADDLQRFLASKPIHARPISRMARSWRWCRRNPMVAGLLAAAVVLAAGLGVLALVLWDNQRQLGAALKQTQMQQEEADRRRLIAEANFQRACVVLHNAPLKHQLEWLEHQGASRLGRQILEKALTLFQGLLIEPGPDPGERLLAAEVHSELGDIYGSLWRRPEASQEYQQAIALLRPLVAEFPQEAGFRNSLAYCFSRLGWVMLDPDRPDQKEREEGFEQAISLYGRLREEFADIPWYRLQLANCWHDLGELRRRNGRFQEGEEAFRHAVPLYQQLFDEFPLGPEGRTGVARTLNDLAWVLAIRPDRGPHHAAEALESARKAVALEPQMGDWWHTLGVAHCRMGHWKEALANIEKSRQLGHETEPPSSFDLFFEAMAYSGLGDGDKARRCYDEGVQWMEKNIPDHADLRRFQAEAAQMLGIQDSKKTEAKAPIP
jgi:serine/threonine-protein kinase